MLAANMPNYRLAFRDLDVFVDVVGKVWNVDLEVWLGIGPSGFQEIRGVAEGILDIFELYPEMVKHCFNVASDSTQIPITKSWFLSH
jgi:hypothetical protein